MIDLAQDEEEAKSYITDLTVEDNTLIVKYADGHEKREKFNLHMLNVYRIRMEEQAKERIEPALDEIAKDSFLTYVKRIATIAVGIILGIVIYNIDIHIIMKIILAILILLGEAVYYFLNRVYLGLISVDLEEIEAMDYYLKHINQFKYYDEKIGENGYIVPFEDIGKYNLTVSELEQLSINVDDLKRSGINNRDIKLTYRNKEFQM